MALDSREQRLVELHPVSKHHLSLIPAAAGKSSTPNSATSAAASVCRLGAAFRSGRLVRRIPGTAAGSMQWSPLQALRLSAKTAPPTAPSDESSDDRVPLAYPTIRSGAVF